MDTHKTLEKEFSEFITKDDLPYYFYIHDTEGVFTYVSHEVTSLLGFDIETFKSFYMDHVTANPLNKEVIKYTLKSLQGIQQAPYKVEIYDVDYKAHYQLVYEKPVFEGKNIVGVKGVAKLLN